MASGRYEGGGLQGIIDLASFADQNAINHESFHAAFWMALSENEQNAIYRKFGKDIVGEENAAFDFEEWRAKKNEASTKEKGNILSRLFEKIMDFSTRIRDAVFRDHKAIFRSIEDGSIWKNLPSPDSQLSGSGRGTETVSVHSQRESAFSFAEQLDAWQNGSLHPRATIKVGNTPEVLTNLGANQLPMEISQNVVDKVVNTDGVSQGKHGLGLEML